MGCLDEATLFGMLGEIAQYGHGQPVTVGNRDREWTLYGEVSSADGSYEGQRFVTVRPESSQELV